MKLSVSLARRGEESAFVAVPTNKISVITTQLESEGWSVEFLKVRDKFVRPIKKSDWPKDGFLLCGCAFGRGYVEELKGVTNPLGVPVLIEKDDVFILEYCPDFTRRLREVNDVMNKLLHELRTHGRAKARFIGC